VLDWVVRAFRVKREQVQLTNMCAFHVIEIKEENENEDEEQEHYGNKKQDSED